MAKRTRGFLTVGLNVADGWPTEKKEVVFKNRTFVLRPSSTEDAPSVMLRVEEGMTDIEAHQLINEFLSGLSWVRRGRMAILTSVFCSGAPMSIGKSPGYGHLDNSCIEHLPVPTDSRAALALALYREAFSVNMLPYQFLGFIKVLNIIHNGSKAQKGWINSVVAQLTDFRARERLSEIQRGYPDVGEYLFTSGRCAIAHAYAAPIVNPDDPRDLQRLGKDLPLVQALAEYAIENELGVKSLHAIHTEHLYELEGFRELWGKSLADAIKAGSLVDHTAMKLPPRLSLRLREKAEFHSLENLLPSILEVSNKVVALKLAADDDQTQIVVFLDFGEERLVQDALRHIAIKDDGAKAGAQRMIDYLEYLKNWMSNGVVEIWDPIKKIRLGRSAPVMLVNARPNWDALEAEIAVFRERLSIG